MKIDINFIRHYGSRIYLNDNISKSFQGESDSFIVKLINRLKACGTDEEASLIANILAIKNPSFKKVTPISFRYNEYLIQNLHKFHAIPYLRNLELLQKLDVSIAPKLVDSVDIEDSLFIISKIDGAKRGELMQYIPSHISQEAKIEAFNDLKKLTRAGIVNQNIIRTPSSIAVVPETGKIIIPNWTELRPMNEKENKALIQLYFDMLFRQQ